MTKMNIKDLQNALQTRPQSTGSRLEEIGPLVITYVGGVAGEEYYAKKKDVNGRTVIENGREVREDKPSGFKYQMVQMGQTLPVDVITPEPIPNLSLFDVFEVSGFGHIFRDAKTNKYTQKYMITQLEILDKLEIEK